MKYAIYRTDGTSKLVEQDAPPSLGELQHLVARHIEEDEYGNKVEKYYVHSSIEFYVTAHEQAHVYINEEGRIMNPPLPRNPFFAEDLRGDVIEVGPDISESGENLGLPDDYVLRTIPKLPEAMFTKGTKWTLIGIGGGLPATTRAQAVAKGHSYRELPVLSEKGKRKEWTIRQEALKDTMVFEGHDLPFCVDSDAPAKRSASGLSSRTVRMNALYNLVGDPDTIRDYVLHNQRNPWWTGIDRINHIDDDGNERLLFPDVAPSCRMVAELQDKQRNIKREHIFVN